MRKSCGPRHIAECGARAALCLAARSSPTPVGESIVLGREVLCTMMQPRQAGKDGRPARLLGSDSTVAPPGTKAWINGF